jgi:hypothetical protein
MAESRLVAICYGIVGNAQSTRIVKTDIPDEDITKLLKNCKKISEIQEGFGDKGEWNVVYGREIGNSKLWLDKYYEGIKVFNEVRTKDKWEDTSRKTKTEKFTNLLKEVEGRGNRLVAIVHGNRNKGGKLNSGIRDGLKRALVVETNIPDETIMELLEKCAYVSDIDAGFEDKGVWIVRDSYKDLVVLKWLYYNYYGLKIFKRAQHHWIYAQNLTSKGL